MTYTSFISPATRFYRLPQPLPLESGGELTGVEVAYRTWGNLNQEGDNAVLVCHALTGSADADIWWYPLFGPGRALDPERDFIICSNILGSCYGTTGPTSIDPATGEAYRANFPPITVRDMVHLQARLLDGLGVRSLKLALGGSLGGMQVLEWALLYPERVGAIASIAASGRHSAWCIGLSEAQRQAIYSDPDWCDGFYEGERKPARGLATARMMAMSTYRSWESFSDRYGREREGQSFAVVDYLRYQGEKLVERFDANSYLSLTAAMDSHDVTRPGRNYESVLESMTIPTLIVGIDSDILYPLAEQEELARLIPGARLAALHSPHGHDAFLIDMDAINDSVVEFRNEIGSYPPHPLSRSENLAAASQIKS